MSQTPPTPNYPSLTLGELLDQVARTHPETEALIDVPSGRRLTYAQFKAQADALARGFMALGLAPGDRLALWCPNRPEWLIAWFAAAKAGLILTSVDLTHQAQQLAYVLGQSQAKALVLAPGVSGGEFLEIFSGLCPEVNAPAPEGISCEPLPELKRVVVIADSAPDGALSWRSVMDLSAAVGPQALAARQAAVGHLDAVTLLYTSGTTGAPKGVLSHHHGLICTSRAGAAHQGLAVGERLCVSVPLAHMFGCVCVALAGILAGASLVFPSPTPQPEAILRALSNEDCVAVYGPPTSFIAMMDLPEYKSLPHPKLRTGIMGGAQCPIEVMRRVVDDMGVRGILVGYGQTEASSWVAQTRPDDPLEFRVSTVGRPLPGVAVRLVDPESGQVVPPGQVGEICVRGYNMKGYFKNPAATAAALDAEGWLHTGDLGSQDARGYIRISGRLKEVIRTGGRIVFPAQVEEVLFTHPLINNAQVFGIDHNELGEEVAAAIRLEKGARVTAEDILAFLRGKLPENHLPRRIKFVEDFPMTPLGKIQKFRLREMFAENGKPKAQ